MIYAGMLNARKDAQQQRLWHQEHMILKALSLDKAVIPLWLCRVNGHNVIEKLQHTWDVPEGSPG